METINDRMEILINKYFGGNKAAFAKSLGLPPTGLSNYLGKQRRSKPGIDMLLKIISTFKVDPLWLLTGKESSETLDPTEEKELSAVDTENILMAEQNAVLAERVRSLERHVQLLEERLADKDRIIQLLDKGNE